MPKLCYVAGGKRRFYRLYSEEELAALCLNVQSGKRLAGNFPLSKESRHLNIRCGGITYMLPLYTERHGTQAIGKVRSVVVTAMSDGHRRSVV